MSLEGFYVIMPVYIAEEPECALASGIGFCLPVMRLASAE
jgi:hypothetical protein